MSKACARCGTHGNPPHDAIADMRCSLWSFARDDVTRHAAALDKPPRPDAVADLVAHLQSRYSEPLHAHAAAITMLDLGWRPAFDLSASTAEATP